MLQKRKIFWFPTFGFRQEKSEERELKKFSFFQSGNVECQNSVGFLLLELVLYYII